MANEPDGRDAAEYAQKIDQIRQDYELPENADAVFVEVTVCKPAPHPRRIAGSA